MSAPWGTNSRDWMTVGLDCVVPVFWWCFSFFLLFFLFNSLIHSSPWPPARIDRKAFWKRIISHHHNQLKAMVFLVVMYGCESWTIKESWAQKNWCFLTVVLEKTLECPLDCKEIQPVNPKGNQSWIFTGRTDAETETPILWPPDAKNWLIGKTLMLGKNGRQHEKGAAEPEMVG